MAAVRVLFARGHAEMWQIVHVREGFMGFKVSIHHFSWSLINHSANICQEFTLKMSLWEELQKITL